MINSSWKMEIDNTTYLIINIIYRYFKSINAFSLLILMFYYSKQTISNFVHVKQIRSMVMLFNKTRYFFKDV